MKRTMTRLLSLLIIGVMIFSFSACNTDNDNGNKDELNINTVYATAVELGYTGTLDELITAFKGDSAYQIAVSKGYTGSETEWIDSLVGSTGSKGDKGNDGLNPEIKDGFWYIGNTNTGVKAKGEDGADGFDGLDGKSAYEIWIANGHTGSETDFLEWLKVNGENGKSAYDIWLANGHIGSQSDFLTWLKGKDGEDGTNGTDGQDGASGADGQDGQNGADGANGVDGKSAYQIWLDNGHEGTQTDFLEWLKGQGGSNGTDGSNGKSAYEIFKQYNPDYMGSEEQWINGLVSGTLKRFAVTFKAIDSADIVKYVWHGFSLEDIPQVPMREGKTGVWDRTDFTNISSNITVNAIYGLEFALINNDTSYSVKSIGIATGSDIVIPDTYKGLPVTNIGAYAFRDCASLENITIANSIASIEAYAFYNCTSLTSLSVPNSVMLIKENAFYNCTSLTDLIIGSGVISIAKNAFYNNGSLMRIAVKLGNSVYKSEGNCLIEIATNKLILGSNTSIIPNYINSIGGGAFYNCQSLTNITIPNNVISIDGGAFIGCENLIIYTPFSSRPNGWADGWSYSKNPTYWGISDTNFKQVDAVQYVIQAEQAILTRYVGNSTSLTIQEQITIEGINYEVTSIGEKSFHGCQSIIDITIPNSVTSINYLAFGYCENLVNVTMGNNVKNIGDYAFRQCYALKNITLPSYMDSIGEGAFYMCKSLININIPNSIMIIERSTFGHCENLLSITIPNTITTIKSSAFSACINLKSITIPNSVADIENDTFDGCTILTIYTSKIIRPSGWDIYWNSFCRIVWGCALSDENGTSYIVSHAKTAISIDNSTIDKSISAPFRKGYTFGGWAISQANANNGISTYTAANIHLAPNNTTLWAIWILD